MQEMNALAIQSKLGDMGYISIPQIQSEFGLGYKDAKAFLHQLMQRGWVANKARGNKYRVIRGNLRLRSVRREEADTLIEDITADCISVLDCIHDKKGGGAVFSELSEAVRGDDDTRDAIGILLKNDLIYCYNDVFFVCVSKKAAKVLSDVVAAKRRNGLIKRFNGKSDEIRSLRAIFDTLFAE